MHQIKIKRALATAAIGRCPGSASDMLRLIPQAIIAAVSSAALAELLDAMWSACCTSKSLAEQAAVSEGAIWDCRTQRLREIAA